MLKICQERREFAEKRKAPPAIAEDAFVEGNYLLRCCCCC